MTNQLQERVQGIEVKELKKMAVELMDNFEDGADLVFDAVIEQLENQLEEDEFIQFMQCM